MKHGTNMDEKLTFITKSETKTNAKWNQKRNKQ